MPLSRRYSPEWAPGERAMIGMDFAAIIPPGVGVSSGSLFIETNSAQPQNAMADWKANFDPAAPGFILAEVRGRTVYVQLTGGVAGTDYRLTWTVIDTDGNEWPRTALLLCAPTS